MKKSIFCFILMFFINFNSSALEVDNFNYDGHELFHAINLSHIERLPSGQIQLIKTEARLIFDSKSSSLGKDINIEVNMNGVDIGMKATNDTNTLALLKLRRSDRWINENTVNVLMEVDVKFFENLNLQSYPFKTTLQDLIVSDDFLSFTSGKIIDPNNIMANVQIYKKKSFGKDDLVFEGNFSGSDLVVTEFGSDRSLLTIDLNKIISGLERGKKHIIKATIATNFGKWRAFNENQKELFKSPEKIEIESNFKY